MKRKTLEKIWILFVLLMITIVCVIGTFAMFNDNPMELLKYVFAIVFIATPINLLMMYFTCSAKG
jgi:O-antigen/teichoic acid export membrane protein